MPDDAVEMLLSEGLARIRSQTLPLAALGATTAEIRDKLIQLERSTDSAVVAALQSACEGYGWPPLTVYEATLAYLRLDWAYDHWQGLRAWDRFLHGDPPDPEQLPGEPYQILEYLLTTGWVAQGFPSILGTLAECDHARAHHGHNHGNS